MEVEKKKIELTEDEAVTVRNALHQEIKELQRKPSSAMGKQRIRELKEAKEKINEVL